LSSSRFTHASVQVGKLYLAKILVLKTIISEPIGSAKPKFSDDLNSKGITRYEQNQVALICPAQAFPIPSFRFECLLQISS
jgi:hypothetical protein